jgi:CubicO group peptidase (beta-lactamase class C family)
MKRIGLIAGGGVLAVVAAVAAWQWPYALNMLRYAREGWITTVDTAVYAPDATTIYAPLDKVAGDAAASPLPRDPNITTWATSRFAELTAFAEAKQSYALLVWSKGALVFEHYGQGLDAAIRPDSASMHKSVAALAVGAAIAQGKIAGLDAPIGAFIPEWRSDTRGSIKLSGVLGMAAGLGPTSNEGGAFSQSNRFLAGLFADEILLARPQIAAPGSAFAYRNFNTQLLGLILERATGQRYADFLSQYVWKPMGAADAAVWLHTANGLPRTYTALMAGGEDWVRIGLLMINRGRVGEAQIIPADYIDAMTTPSTLYANYGLQVWLAKPNLPMRYYNPSKPGLGSPAREPWGTDDMVFFDGVGGQRVYISRAEDLVIVRLGVARADWDDSELPNMVMKALSREE